MGYLHINNLYKDQRILCFRECYALEKVHGTSAHIGFHVNEQLHFFSGGEKHERFVKLFDTEKLVAGFQSLGAVDRKITVYGEAYGGSQQGMSGTYGKELAFVVFDVQIGDSWLDVPNAEQVATNLGLEFVPYYKVSTDVPSIDAERDRDSEVAMRRGCGLGKRREGVVLRPPFEVTLNNGERLIAKHKRDEFRETKSPRLVDQAQLVVLKEAELIAQEWVTIERLHHVLDKIPGHCIEKMGEIIKAVVDDVLREGSGELVDSKAARKAIASKAAELYKAMLKQSLASK